MSTEDPIIILECPECHEMNAARSRYAPKKDSSGNPVAGFLIVTQCWRCITMKPGNFEAFKLKQDSELEAALTRAKFFSFDRGK